MYNVQSAFMHTLWIYHFYHFWFPVRGGREWGRKSQKMLRKRRKKPHFLKSAILRLKQGFQLLAEPLFLRENI